MDRHDFSEFYEKCGSFMQSEIIRCINAECSERKPYDYDLEKSCATYLLSMNDDDFYNLYLELISVEGDLENYYTADYTVSMCKTACLFNEQLLHRCIAISALPIDILLERASISICNYIQWNIYTYKLLYEIGINIFSLLSIANLSNDYIAMSYIIDNMTELDLGNYLIHKFEAQIYKFKGLLNILIINKINSIGSKYLKFWCKTRMLNALKIIEQGVIANDFIITCYYIIQCMTREEGITYMQSIDSNIIGKLWLNKSQLINVTNYYNSMLGYYLNPRGSRTKPANTTTTF
jgi:hypothetical protein